VAVCTNKIKQRLCCFCGKKFANRDTIHISRNTKQKMINSSVTEPQYLNQVFFYNRPISKLYFDNTVARFTVFISHGYHERWTSLYEYQYKRISSVNGLYSCTKICVTFRKVLEKNARKMYRIFPNVKPFSFCNVKREVEMRDMFEEMWFQRSTHSINI